ncbi:MAG TPA: hypothetical protein VKU02_22780 [Gemmataceae bacterium]|nr:hypothetical protein [Gemmataceae bacterium]
MPSKPSQLARLAALIIVLFAGPIDRARGEPTEWSPEKAANYLDERQRAWFGSAQCISCHTGLPYALARPALDYLAGAKSPSESEAKLFTQVRLRVANWKHLDSKEFGLYYDATDQLKVQSWGTEAVFNAAILAFDDRYQGRTSPTEATKLAFSHLWDTQVQTGDGSGSWEWLDFNEPPWGSKGARYVGAALAAVAVGTAPGYYTPGADAGFDAHVNRLRGYLRLEFRKQNLHHQVWGLWAAAKIGSVLTKTEQEHLTHQLLDKQRTDGGWNLPSLGPWTRSLPMPETASDGYATSFIVHVLRTAGLPKEDVKLAKGLDWLKRNQTATGAWQSRSLIKKRDPASHSGKFMSDAATAFAVLALSP